MSAKFQYGHFASFEDLVSLGSQPRWTTLDRRIDRVRYESRRSEHHWRCECGATVLSGGVAQ